MIRKLIIFGIIAVTVVLLVPNLVKNSHNPTLEAIKNHIDYAPANHGKGNDTSSVGYGSTLTQSGSISTDTNGNNNVQSNNIGAAATGQTSITSLPPQDFIKQTHVGQVFQNTNGTCQVSVPDMAQIINGQTELTYIIQVPNCNLSVNRPVQVTTITPKQNDTQSPDQGNTIQVVPYVNSNNNDNSNPSTTSFSNAPTSSTPVSPPYFQTIQLNVINQGTNVLLSYDDTTGQTMQVTVTMKNSEKILFSGSFYASQFHTAISDAQNTHIIEMTIQNSIYGILHASIYAPSNIQNSTISGIFTNSSG